jgi:hypothetical protein
MEKLRKHPDNYFALRTIHARDQRPSKKAAVMSVTAYYVKPRHNAGERTILVEEGLKPVYPNAHYRACGEATAFKDCKCVRGREATQQTLPSTGGVSWLLRRPCHARGCIYNEVRVWSAADEEEYLEPAEARALPEICHVFVREDDVKIVCVYKSTFPYPYYFRESSNYDTLTRHWRYEDLGAATIEYVNGRYRVNVDAVHHEPYPLANWDKAKLLSQGLNEIDEPIVAELLQKRLIQASLGYTQVEAEAAEREDELEELLSVDMWKWLDEVTKEDFNERYAEAAAV